MLALTEIRLLHLGQDYGNKAWEQTCQAIVSNGCCKGLFHGQQVENPDITTVFVSWSSVNQHQNCLGSR
jgi:hypothetical protein